MSVLGGLWKSITGRLQIVRDIHLIYIDKLLIQEQRSTDRDEHGTTRTLGSASRNGFLGSLLSILPEEARYSRGQLRMVSLCKWVDLC